MRGVPDGQEQTSHLGDELRRLNGVGAGGGDLLMGLCCERSDDLLFRTCHRIETRIWLSKADTISLASLQRVLPIRREDSRGSFLE